MRGIRGISEELDKIADPLLSTDLVRVLNAAIQITGDDYSRDWDISRAVASYTANPHADPALADEVARKSRECDEAYIVLEEQGRMEESAANYRKMFVLNGLHSLFAAPSLTPVIVDDIIYDLGHGAHSMELFAERMIQKLTSQ